MARKWIVVVPDGSSVTLSLGYLDQSFKHGSFVRGIMGESLSKEYPAYFKEIVEETKPKEKPVEPPKETNVNDLLKKLQKVSQENSKTPSKSKEDKKVKPANKLPEKKK